MALDEPGKDDKIFDEKGTKFLIEPDIFDQAKPINVDFVLRESYRKFQHVISEVSCWRKKG